MKKTMLLALCLILAGLLAVNGTFASEFTQAINEVVSSVFKTVEALLDKAAPQSGGDIVNVELVTDTSTSQLYPGGKASYTTAVKNEGTQPVYFRLAFAVQYDSETWNQLDITFTSESANFVQSGWKDIKLADGTDYKMMVITYCEKLAADTSACPTSPDVTMTIAMDASITSEQLARYRSDFLQVQALAIGANDFTEETLISASGNTTAEKALNLALPIDANFNPF